ncbi:hypothetical protein LPJ53_000586 [Coemansia erecta]|uniref:Choline/carnitine acyltransferase domain-containing protein n=1 Tax=Coemansia erecta TaxID=147472 RepID=A0A9W7Y653_9FUNG|nr:hypothetical protein LPJ53_000586 [Coemansia erecta]
MLRFATPQAARMRSPASAALRAIAGASRHRSTTAGQQEASIKPGGTFSSQASLPRLPIPTLKETATRYLKSLEPLLAPADYARSEKAVAEFVSDSGLGPVLQQRLQQVDREAQYSWLEDIWLKKAYLEWRGPSYINVNWYALVGDNPHFAVLSDVPRGQITEVQLQRAARLITHMLEANEALNAQAIPVDAQKGQPMCMDQFKWQFGTTRIPRMGCDELVHQYPSTARHILLMYRNQAVEVPVYSADGKRASLVQIAGQLAQATRSVDKDIAAAGARPPVANLTAAHRDDWAQARALLEQDAGNRASLASVDAALFGVCLDVDVDARDTADHERAMAVLAHSDAGANRWYDKAMQLVVLSNGRVGVNCEHAPVDALTTGRLLMEAAAKERGVLRDLPPAAGLAPPTPLQWNVTADVAEAVTKARSDARDLAADLRILLGGVSEYGAQWIKTLGVSPDAFFQVALQAAHLRHHGRPVATYESASLRRFLHGRTETIRSCTADAQAFARALDDRDTAEGAKLELFRRAAATHTALTAAAAQGQGVDRHLLGLRAQLRSAAEAERASLFADPAFAQSCAFVLSTSNVTPGDMFRGGFAPVVADGYGINYAMDREDIKFSLSDWRPSAATDAPAFRETIARTLRDLHAAGVQALSKQ